MKSLFDRNDFMSFFFKCKQSIDNFFRLQLTRQASVQPGAGDEQQRQGQKPGRRLFRGRN